MSEEESGGLLGRRRRQGERVPGYIVSKHIPSGEFLGKLRTTLFGPIDESLIDENTRYADNVIRTMVYRATSILSVAVNPVNPEDPSHPIRLFSTLLYTVILNIDKLIRSMLQACMPGAQGDYNNCVQAVKNSVSILESFHTIPFMIADEVRASIVLNSIVTASRSADALFYDQVHTALPREFVPVEIQRQSLELQHQIPPQGVVAPSGLGGAPSGYPSVRQESTR